MKKSKKKLIIVLISLVVLIILSILGVYAYNNAKYNYSFSEKKWINDNINNIININLGSNLPAFSKDGTGVFIDFIDDLEKDTGLSFNIVYDNSSDFSLNVKNSLGENDYLFYEDHFVVVSNNKVKISSINDLKNYKVGVLSKDMSDVSSYLTDYNLSLTTFNTIDDMKESFNSSTINLGIIPMYNYLDNIISSSLNISYHLGGLKSYYTLSVSPNNKDLSSIMTKFLHKWSKVLDDKINENFLDIYYEIKEYTELQKESIINDDLVIGYIDNIPFEGKVNRRFSGITSIYLDKFASLTGATYDYVKYKDNNKLLNALGNEKVDIVMNYYGIGSGKYVNSITLGNNEIVVLASKNSNLIVDTLYSLKGKNITTLSNRNLKNQLVNKNIFNIVEFENIEKMLKKVDDNSIIIIEKEVYDYYKTNKLRKYNIRYSYDTSLNNSFLLKQSNSALNDLFNFYLTTLNSSEINTLALNKSLKNQSSNFISAFIINNIIYITLAVVVIIFILIKINKKVKLSKKIKKEDKMMYLDVMTNLKNRNYLNDNIDYWEKNIVFPQTIIIIDLNNVKMLNDQFGHEEGDAQIKAAANVLIRNQRDNSDIIRTDGNEFLIYMIGYEEKVVLSYIHKINKEIKNALPHKEYGVALGYSMIKSELETIDDAINEASQMMRNNKEVSREKES